MIDLLKLLYTLSLVAVANTTVIAYQSIEGSESAEAINRIQIERNIIHLRCGAQREWSRYPETSAGPNWKTTFQATANEQQQTLLVRQIDVRRIWSVRLNGKDLGRLKRDANDQVSYFNVPANSLKDGENELAIESRETKAADDIEVGPISLLDATSTEFLSQSHLKISVTDRSSESRIPCRLTIVDENDSLVPTAASSTDKLAVRTGVIYCVDGQAEFGLPAGRYRIFAGRGFEYSRAESQIDLRPGDRKQVALSIQRVIDTRGEVCCDTHVHTVTYSGHGDCTITERMVTIAGEGIELPIATDHNKQIDYEPFAQKTNSRRFFTPVIGNEVTTDFGHFNALPFARDAPVPDHKETDWDVLIPSILETPNASVVILNHGRDIHRGYRPFAPENFNEVTGESLNGRKFLFNAMEVINSAAQQTDQFELYRDWMALTNRGHRIIPIGSSDSHDVNAFIVGQGRTYIRCDDSDAGKIDVDQAVKNLIDGRVSVSAGLMARIVVNNRFKPGDLVPRSDTVEVRCAMLGPHWVRGNQMQLYENGLLIKEHKEREPGSAQEGTKAEGTKANFRREVVWKWKARPHDSFLSLVVSGPGISHQSWRLSQPYQPTGPDWNPRVIGLTGACYLDADGDGKFTPAFAYAQQLVKQSGGDLQRLVDSLARYDQSVAEQAASIFQAQHGNLLDDSLARIWEESTAQTKSGFTRFLTAWRKSEIARAEK